MNNLKYLLSITLLLGAFVMIGCGDDDDGDGDGPSAEELQLQMIAKTWQVQTVTFEGTDVTEATFSNFSITFGSDKTFTTSNGEPIFTGGGLWDFGSTLDIIIVDGVTMTTLINADASALRLTFTAAGESIGSKKSGLTGDYVFDLLAQ
ncbi:MAG: DUF5004 domain-containing protein [Bacteroidota bacterium]